MPQDLQDSNQDKANSIQNIIEDVLDIIQAECSKAGSHLAGIQFAAIRYGWKDSYGNESSYKANQNLCLTLAKKIRAYRIEVIKATEDGVVPSQITLPGAVIEPPVRVQ